MYVYVETTTSIFDIYLTNICMYVCMCCVCVCVVLPQLHGRSTMWGRSSCRRSTDPRTDWPSPCPFASYRHCRELGGGLRSGLHTFFMFLLLQYVCVYVCMYEPVDRDCIAADVTAKSLAAVSAKRSVVGRGCR